MAPAQRLPHHPRPRPRRPEPERAGALGRARLPSAAGRGMANSLFFTSCWGFGESLPLKTAGPVAVVSEG